MELQRRAMTMMHKIKSLYARTGALEARQILQNEFTKIQPNSPPPKRSFAASIKNVLVILGTKGLIPKRLCHGLINKLGLRGE